MCFGILLCIAFILSSSKKVIYEEYSYIFLVLKVVLFCSNQYCTITIAFSFEISTAYVVVVGKKVDKNTTQMRRRELDLSSSREKMFSFHF